MAEDEVLKALNVLKRCGKIDSILFFEVAKSILYLPDVSFISLNTNDDGQYELVYAGTKYYWNLGKDTHKRLINQWKQARLATAFLY